MSGSMIGQLGDPSMTPEQAAQAHVELNEKFGRPATRLDDEDESAGEAKIQCNASDPDVPELLWNAYRMARIHESGGRWIGKPWDELSERKRKRFTFTVELFAESLGWDQ